MNKKNPNQRVKGFTLIEVLVALCLLMVVLLPITTILTMSNRQLGQNEKTLQAKSLAQSKIEEIKALDWQDFKTNYLVGQTFPQNHTEAESDFSYQVYVWPTNNHLSHTIQVTVFYQEAGQDKWQCLYTEKSRR